MDGLDDAKTSRTLQCIIAERKNMGFLVEVPLNLNQSMEIFLLRRKEKKVVALWRSTTGI